MNDQKNADNGEHLINNYLASPYIMPDFFTRAECEAVVAASGMEAEYSGYAGEVARSDKLRKSTVRFIAPAEHTTWIYNKLQAAVIQANNFYRFDISGIRERLQVAEYMANGHYTWHVDVGKMKRQRVS